VDAYRYDDERRDLMPMIDVYSVAGTFRDKHTLAKDLANAVMRWEKVPPIVRVGTGRGPESHAAGTPTAIRRNSCTLNKSHS